MGTAVATAVVSIRSLLVLFAARNVDGFEWSSNGGQHTPVVDRKSIAGIWKLTSTGVSSSDLLRRPMKEFTVYPKKIPEQQSSEVLLMLNEDGSFKKYGSAMTPEALNDDGKNDIDSSWSYYQRQQVQKQAQQESYIDGVVKGTWAYRDGQLLLAADRIDDGAAHPLYQTLADGYAKPSLPGIGASTTATTPTTTSTSSKQDTLLKGRLVASYLPQLPDNPVLAASSSSSLSTTNTTSPLPKTIATTASDTQLSVPKGSVNIGKFFYPKNHPSFFDQPMFQPVKRGTFALRQVLGNLNVKGSNSDDEEVEKFRRSDFYNKTFWLTSHPLGSSNRHVQPKGEKRWSIKYNAYVYDAPSKKTSDHANKRATAANAAAAAAVGIRVLQVTFHKNNTFSTTAGLGNSAILRGKFDVIGTKKDHLWMQVIRFGFGRSVSGSVYSEGKMLSHEDAKAYWGSISIVDDSAVGSNDKDLSAGPEMDAERDSGTTTDAIDSTIDGNSSGTIDMASDTSLSPTRHRRLEVEGSVLDGWGLEPAPVARFTLRETTNEEGFDEADDEDDEEDDDDERVLDESLAIETNLEDDGVDWSSSQMGGDSFQ